MQIYITAAPYTNTNSYRVNYVIATASADDLEVTLTDTSGVPFFQAESAITGERFFPICLNGQKVVGIKSATWANVESVIIGAEPVAD